MDNNILLCLTFSFFFAPPTCQALSLGVTFLEGEMVGSKIGGSPKGARIESIAMKGKAGGDSIEIQGDVYINAGVLGWQLVCGRKGGWVFTGRWGNP